MSLVGSPKVSVIIPCFNAGRYLADAIQSVLDQSYVDFEVIIVDDGSTDGTQAVAQSFADSRLRYIHQPHQGRSSARNAGIRAAKGALVAFLDADDWFMPRKLEIQERFLTLMPEVGLVAGGWAETDESGSILVERRMWEAHNLAVQTWLFSCPVTVSSVLVRKGWLEKVGFFDGNLKRVEDWDLWLRLALAGCQMMWVPEIVARYRYHEGNSVRDIELMRTSMFQLLDKVFAAEPLPAEISRLRTQAYAQAHLQIAARAYGAKEWELARRELALAIKLGPDLARAQPPPVVQELRGWSRFTLVGPAEQYLEAISEHLPGNARTIRGHMRRVLAEELINRAFASHHGGRSSEARSLIVKSVRKDPRLLANMGVLSMMVESFLGRRLAQRCRSLARWFMGADCGR